MNNFDNQSVSQRSIKSAKSGKSAKSARSNKNGAASTKNQASSVVRRRVPSSNVDQSSNQNKQSPRGIASGFGDDTNLNNDNTSSRAGSVA